MKSECEKAQHFQPLLLGDPERSCFDMSIIICTPLGLVFSSAGCHSCKNPQSLFPFPTALSGRIFIVFREKRASKNKCKHRTWLFNARCITPFYVWDPHLPLLTHCCHGNYLQTKITKAFVPYQRQLEWFLFIHVMITFLRFFSLNLYFIVFFGKNEQTGRSQW